MSTFQPLYRLKNLASILFLNRTYLHETLILPSVSPNETTGHQFILEHFLFSLIDQFPLEILTFEESFPFGQIVGFQS